MPASDSKLLAPYRGPWNEQKARHFLNRTGFGATVEETEAALKEPLAAGLQRRLHYENTPDAYPSPEWAVPPTAAQIAEIHKSGENAQAEMRKMRAAGEKDRKTLARVLRGARNLEQELERRDALTIYSQKGVAYTFELQKWWLRRMAETTRPLQEKLTLFWHGHFATSNFKVSSAYYMWLQNETMRRNASGNFHTMIMEMSKDPAMIKWLDNDSNVKEHPNENYAREVMELFTLGEGNYTEDDIKQAARAFTGWSYSRAEMCFKFNPAQHDDGEKLFFGKKGNWNGGDIVNMIFEQPACAKFIAKKLWTYFAYEEPEAELVDGLAQVFREGKYELKPLLERMFSCDAFFSERAVRTQIKSPVQLAIGSCQLLRREIPDPIESFSVIVKALRLMGQEPLMPADVSGWKGGLTWVNTSSLLMRYNFANFLVNGVPTADMVGLRTAKQEYISEAVAKVKEKEKATAVSKADQVKRSTIAPLAVEKLGDRAALKNSDAVVRHFARVLWDGQAEEESLRQFKQFLDTSESGAPEPFRPEQPNANQKIRGLVHLMMSTPQYQLC